MFVISPSELGWDIMIFCVIVLFLVVCFCQTICITYVLMSKTWLTTFYKCKLQVDEVNPQDEAQMMILKMDPPPCLARVDVAPPKPNLLQDEVKDEEGFSLSKTPTKTLAHKSTLIRDQSKT
jgi:hypothetical protein